MVMTPEVAAEAFKGRVFLINIKIKQACPAKLQFDPEQTRSPEVVETIKRNGGSLGKDGIPLFEVLGDNDKPIFSASSARNRVATVLDGMQEKFMKVLGASGDWYVPESRIADLEAAIASELDLEVRNQLEYFADYYDEAKSLFCDRLHDSLRSFGLLDWEEYYLTKFPSLDEIEANFGYEILKWEPQKTLEEVLAAAASDPALKRTAEVLDTQLKAIQEDAPKLQDEALGHLAAIAHSLESADPDADTWPKIQADITAKLERVQTINDLWAGILHSPNSLLDTVKHEFKMVCDRIPDLPINLPALIQVLREEWQSTLSLPEFGEGAIAFTHWLYPEKGIQAQIKEIEAKLQGELAPKSRARWENKLADLQEALAACQPQPELSAQDIAARATQLMKAKKGKKEEAIAVEREVVPDETRMLPETSSKVKIDLF